MRICRLPKIFETLTGNVLGDPGPAGIDNLALSVNFSRNLAAVELDFATSDFSIASPLTLTAYENSKLHWRGFRHRTVLEQLLLPRR
jgi:hypothetical protein